MKALAGKLKNKAVFLDRDGVLNFEVDVLRSMGQLKMVKTAPRPLRRLKKAGYKLIVVSNQPVVARGWLTKKQVKEINRKLEKMFAEEGVTFEGFYFCPHHPNANLPRYRKDCDCRKPKPGMLLQAQKDLKIDFKKSWIIGDSFRDILAGQAAGVRTIEVETVGKKGTHKNSPPYRSDYKARTLAEAVKIILQ